MEDTTVDIIDIVAWLKLVLSKVMLAKICQSTHDSIEKKSFTDCRIPFSSEKESC